MSVLRQLSEAELDAVSGGAVPVSAGEGVGNAFGPGNSGMINLASFNADGGLATSTAQSGHMFNGGGVFTAMVAGANPSGPP